LDKIIERGLKLLNVKIIPEAMRFLVESSNGDVRIAINVLEISYKINVEYCLLDKIEQAQAGENGGGQRYGQQEAEIVFLGQSLINYLI